MSSKHLPCSVESTIQKSLVRRRQPHYKALEYHDSSENICPNAPGTLCWKGCLCLLPQFCLGNMIFLPSDWGSPGTWECWHRPLPSPQSLESMSEAEQGAGLRPVSLVPCGDVSFKSNFSGSLNGAHPAGSRQAAPKPLDSEQEDHMQRSLGSWILCDMCQGGLVMYCL